MPEFTVEALASALERAQLPSSRLLVACSGGLDSTVLLHALAALREAQAGLRLRAVHVHHGLQPDADAWALRCARACRDLDVPLDSVRANVSALGGESLEMAARRVRYAELAERLADGEVLVTAHHADDQMETVLMRLLRGSGPHGLAGMRALRPFAGGVLWRPLLTWPRAALHAWAQVRGLGWIDDPSNADPRHDRAWLRTQVMPAIRARWPAAAAGVGRAAQLAGESDALLAELAVADAGVTLTGGTLPLERLRALSPARQRNLLRQLLIARRLTLPSRRRLEEARRQLLAGADDRHPVVSWAGGELRRHRGRVHALATLPAVPVGGGTLDRDAPYRDAAGELMLEPASGPAALSAQVLRGGLTVRYRRGGERLEADAHGSFVALADWLHSRGVPTWWRERVPLLYAGDRLVAVADCAVAAGCAPASHERGWRVRWAPDAALGERPAGLCADGGGNCGQL